MALNFGLVPESLAADGQSRDVNRWNEPAEVFLAEDEIGEFTDDPAVISRAVRNWKGLMPEERWWLYTMTNAATGGLRDNNGWRKALRYALCENPVVERQERLGDIQTNMFGDI
jgi:hypothetical protein